jgi:hypothetical protein
LPVGILRTIVKEKRGKGGAVRVSFAFFLMKPVETKSGRKQVDGLVQPESKTRPKKAVAAKKKAAPGLKPASATKVRNYKKLAKKELSQAFPDIVDVLIERAKEGSLTHTKFLFEIGGGKDQPSKRGARQRHPSLAEMLLDEVTKRREEAQAQLPEVEGESGSM